jgi:hypothetical protein
MAERRQDDPYTEPDNSTVDDWHGQEVDREKELADRAVEETGGDMKEAERRFEADREGSRRE